MRAIEPIERTFRRQLNKTFEDLFVSTQTYVATCPEGTEGGVSVTRTATSPISQAAADAAALKLAQDEAEAELVCQYHSQQCMVPVCAGSAFDEICRDGYSPVSQDDADEIALSLVQQAVEDFCNEQL